MENTKIQSFTQLKVWQSAHKLVIDIYTITRNFPKEERYSLADQMRRCSVSISSNIAEGFSRQNKKEKIQFYFMAKGSLTELQNQLLIARDVNYLLNKNFIDLANKTVEVHKMLNSFIRGAKEKL